VKINSTGLINHRGLWQYLEAAEYATLEWLDWFNHRTCANPSTTCGKQGSSRLTTINWQLRPDSIVMFSGNAGVILH